MFFFLYRELAQAPDHVIIRAANRPYTDFKTPPHAAPGKSHGLINNFFRRRAAFR